MAKTLRVVVPPHPLIAHWLTVLRHEGTPPALFRTAMEELGRWLSYEAMRDWLPHRRDVVKTPLGSAEGTVIETGVPLLARPTNASTAVAKLRLGKHWSERKPSPMVFDANFEKGLVIYLGSLGFWR